MYRPKDKCVCKAVQAGIATGFPPSLFVLNASISTDCIQQRKISRVLLTLITGHNLLLTWRKTWMAAPQCSCISNWSWHSPCFMGITGLLFSCYTNLFWSVNFAALKQCWKSLRWQLLQWYEKGNYWKKKKGRWKTWLFIVWNHPFHSSTSRKHANEHRFLYFQCCLNI